MADFKEFGDKACSFAKNMADKANDAVEVQKLKAKIRDCIGASIYNRYKEDDTVDAEYLDPCGSIDEKYEEIAELNDKIDIIKGCMRCPNCQAPVNTGDAFCSKCGRPL